MTDDKLILKVSKGLPPYLNPIRLADDLYPGVAISVKTDFKGGDFAVDSFIIGSSSVSVKTDGARVLTIGFESLPGSDGESTLIGFVIKINENYVVQEISSDTDVDVTQINIRVFGPNPSLNFMDDAAKQ